MLKPLMWSQGDRDFEVDDLVRFSECLPGVFAARMRQMQDACRALAGFFHAAAVMMQIPGGADYECFSPDDENTVDVDDWEFIQHADLDMLFSIMAECFKRLGADPKLLEQVPGGKDYRAVKLPVSLRLTIAEQSRKGHLNIVAACLDRIIVIPLLPRSERPASYGPNPKPRRRRKSKSNKRKSRTRRGRSATAKKNT